MKSFGNKLFVLLHLRHDFQLSLMLQLLLFIQSEGQQAFKPTQIFCVFHILRRLFVVARLSVLFMQIWLHHHSGASIELGRKSSCWWLAGNRQAPKGIQLSRDEIKNADHSEKMLSMSLTHKSTNIKTPPHQTFLKCSAYLRMIVWCKQFSFMFTTTTNYRWC